MQNLSRTPSLKKENDSFLLTSRPVQLRDDGNYQFDEAFFLIPHELIRREMIRFESTLEHFNPHTNPWKIACLHKYYVEFFYPFIHEHHDVEEKMLFPYYKKLGADFPSKMAEDHVGLMAKLDHIKELITDLNTLNDLNNSELLTEKKNKFVDKVHELVSTMNDHLEEEEIVWPPIVKNYGEKAMNEIEEVIVKHALSQSGKLMQLGLAGVFQSMGRFIHGKGSQDYKGWAGEEFITAFEKKIPYPVRLLLLPGWDRAYNKLKQMLLSVNGEENLKLHEDKACCSFQCVIL